MATGIKLLVTGSLYFILVSIILGSASVLNIDIFGISGTLGDEPDSFTDESGDFDSPSLIDFYVGLLSFSIDGLPIYWSFILVYFPLTIIGLGIAGVIRGV